MIVNKTSYSINKIKWKRKRIKRKDQRTKREANILNVTEDRQLQIKKQIFSFIVEDCDRNITQKQEKFNCDKTQKMRRNARSNQHVDDYSISTVPYNNILLSEPPSNLDSTDDILQMDIISSRQSSAYNSSKHRFENTIEAKVEPGDTLQAIALRFHCTVADIKRLNKIDKDNEIHARKVVKIPVTVHNVLLDNFPTVHKSGNNSPKPEEKFSNNGSRDSASGLSSIVRNPLEDAEAMLSEKLMVASVNSSGIDEPSTCKAALGNASNINNIILNSKLKSGVYCDEASNLDDVSAPLITDILDDSTNVPQLRRIPGPSIRAMDWSGSDCDMSWICLFVVILALCFVIPLIYVFYIAEHVHQNTTHH